MVSQYLQEFREGTGQTPPKRPAYALDHDWFGEVAHDLAITIDDDPIDAGRRLLAFLEEQAISQVVASLDDEGLRRAVDDCFVGVGNGGARTLMEIAQGNFEEARSRIESAANAFGDDDPGVVFSRNRLRDTMNHTR